MALSTLLVADRDSEAPNTAMAETSARPTMSADAVCAVRRGLRMEFSAAEPARHAEQAGQRPADDARHRARHGRRQPGHADEDQDGAEADEGDRRCRQADGEGDHARQRDADPPA